MDNEFYIPPIGDDVQIIDSNFDGNFIVRLDDVPSKKVKVYHLGNKKYQAKWRSATSASNISKFIAIKWAENLLRSMKSQ